MNDAITNIQRREACISRTVYDWHFACENFFLHVTHWRSAQIKSKHIYLCRYQFHFRFMMCPLDNWRFSLSFPFCSFLPIFAMYEIWAVKVDPDDDWNRNPFGIMAKLWQINWDLNLRNELLFHATQLTAHFIETCFFLLFCNIIGSLSGMPVVVDLTSFPWTQPLRVPFMDGLHFSLSRLLNG